LRIDTVKKIWQIVPLFEPYSINSKGFKVTLFDRITPPLDGIAYWSEHSERVPDVVVEKIEVWVGKTEAYK
jgi:hypothetical protein